MVDSKTDSGFAPNRWAVLALLGVAQLMVVLDATIVNIALPSAQRTLHFSTDSRQWVITAYALAFGSLLLLGGKLGDLFGRKWTFIAGLAGFSLASALGGFAQSFGMLVAARGLQGIFGALLAPSALSLLTVTFAGSPDRAKAFGIFGAIAGGGASVGLLLGGVLTAGAVVALVPVCEPRDRDPDGVRRDAPAAQRSRPAAPADRHPRRARRDRRPVRARLRLLERRDALLVGARDDRRARAQRDPAERFRARREPRVASTSAVAHRAEPRARRRVCVDRARRLWRVRRVPLPHFLSAAEPRLLAAEDRFRVPADDGRDRRHLDNRADEAARPNRRQAARRRRDGARHRRDGAVRSAQTRQRLRRATCCRA